MHDNQKIEEVKDGKIQLEGLSCIGIGLRPMPGTVGRFPLIVVINGETHLPVEIDSARIYTHHTLIETMEVDVRTLGGGVDGDTWRVTKKRTANEGVEGNYPTNDDGALVTVPSGERVLFEMDSRVNAGPFIAAFSGSLIPEGKDAVDYEVTPANRNAFTWGTNGAKWNVGAFSRVLFGVEAGSPNGPGSVVPLDSIRGWVYGYGRPTSVDTLALASCGTVNEFGTNGGVVWSGVCGSVLLGTGVADASDAYSTSSSTLMPYARFVMRLNVDAVTTEQLASGEYWMHLYAVGLYP